VFDYAARREQFAEQLAAAGADAAFLPLSSDLEYLTGLRRGIPNFGNVSYAHGWVAGCFLRPAREPIFIVPRMYAEFDLEEPAPGDVVVVRETADGAAMFADVARSLGPVQTLAVGARTWAETLIHAMGALGSPRLLSAEPLVNRIRRVKSPQELEVMTRAAAICDGTMAAVTRKVRVGVTMNELVEEVEHQMRARGSLTPSFTTHIFTGGWRTPWSRAARVQRGPSARARPSCSTSAPCSMATARTSVAPYSAASRPPGICAPTQRCWRHRRPAGPQHVPG